jgi:alpha-L-arabinofuranosidase
MFNDNRGDTLLPCAVSLQGLAPSEFSTAYGGVGVGTWSTDAQFKDLKVTRPDGSVLLAPDFSMGLAGWHANGLWMTDNDAGQPTLHQRSPGTNCRAYTGDSNWMDYTFSLKARKNSGAEGFLILFHARDSQNSTWWNIGGWNNTRSVLEMMRGDGKTALGDPVAMSVETGRWYDVRIETRGRHIQCYLDGQLVTEADYPAGPQPEPVYATASRETASGDVILKVVNFTPAPQGLTIHLQGARTVESQATGVVLSAGLGDTNTVDEPHKVVPRKLTISDAAATFGHDFPAHSVTVLRIKTR